MSKEANSEIVQDLTISSPDVKKKKGRLNQMQSEKPSNFIDETVAQMEEDFEEFDTN